MNDDVSFSDEIDIRELITGLLKRWKVIVIGVSSFTLLALVISLMIPIQYESTGFYSINILTVKYKSYLGLYEDINMLGSFVEKYGADETWDLDNSIFKDAFTPIYSFGKEPKNLRRENKVIGIQITVSGETPEIARKRVELLGKYITTNIVNLHLWDHYGHMRKQIEASIISHKKGILGSGRHIRNLKRKMKLINDNLLEYDSKIEVRERQVVQIDEATAKYLPPHQQLVATKVSIHTAEVALEKIHLTIKQDSLKLGFVDAIDGFFDNKDNFIINQDLLQMIVNAKNEYFSTLGTQNYIMDISLGLDGQFAKFATLRDSTYRFTSGPFLPRSPDGPPAWLILLGAFVLSLFIFLIYSFFMSWWESNS